MKYLLVLTLLACRQECIKYETVQVPESEELELDLVMSAALSTPMFKSNAVPAHTEKQCVRWANDP